MLVIVLVAFISLISLLVLHEFSHFVMAKKFGLPVEEFGIGYPPRLIGKKIGETIYSLNLLPFGAFVKIPEDQLQKKSIAKRAIIIAAGIISFWLIALILMCLIFNIGTLMQVSDEEINVSNPQVQIILIVPGSPAAEANLKTGDAIVAMRTQSIWLWIDKINQVQEFCANHKGEKITLMIQREKQVLDIDIVPRVSAPLGEGPLGIGLVRLGKVKYPFLESLWQALITTIKLTGQIVLGFYELIKNIILRKPLEAELMGPVGILDIFVKASSLGFVYFIQTIMLISLQVAVINALPIPVTDGGKLFFLAIEKIRKKPINEKIEEKINAIFFALLITLMIWVTIKDINRLF